MASGKKIGGIRRGSSPAPTDATGPPKRKRVQVGGLRHPAYEPAIPEGPGPSKAKQVGGLVRQAAECECGGLVVKGMWIHAARCPRTVVLWFAHGFKATDWTGGVYRCCPRQCEGTVLPSGVTHSHDCRFWDATDAVPFGMTKPKGEAYEGEPSDFFEEPDDDLPF